MKIIFSKNVPRSVSKMLHLITVEIIFISILFGHFNQKNQSLVNFEYCAVNIQSRQI